MKIDSHNKWHIKHYEWMRYMMEDPNPRAILYPVNLSVYTNPNLDTKLLKRAMEELPSDTFRKTVIEKQIGE